MAGTTVVLQEDLDNAAAKMDSAHDQLNSIIASTESNALSGLDASIQGDVRVACIELINGWKSQTTGINDQLQEFRTHMTTINQEAGQESAAAAKAIASIDFSGRLG